MSRTFPKVRPGVPAAAGEHDAPVREEEGGALRRRHDLHRGRLEAEQPAARCGKPGLSEKGKAVT